MIFLDLRDRIDPLVKTTKFPLSVKQITAFKVLKDYLAYASLGHIDENVLFVLETDMHPMLPYLLF